MSPFRKLSTTPLTASGTRFDATEITPFAPSAMAVNACSTLPQ